MLSYGERIGVAGVERMVVDKEEEVVRLGVEEGRGVTRILEKREGRGEGSGMGFIEGIRKMMICVFLETGKGR
jgi:hypothetical protein